MAEHEWVEGFPGNIEVCDPDGILIEMNDRAAEQEGGRGLIGTNILDCHPEPSRSKLKAMLQSGQANVYTIQKKGKKELVYQAPWYRDGRYAGFVELVLDLPESMPHLNRDQPADSAG
jgi:hypothetical protein